MKQFQLPELQQQLSEIQGLTNQISQRWQSCATDILNECTSTNTKHLEHLGKCKDLQEALILQLHLMNENRTHFLHCFKKMTNTCLENMEDLNQFSNKWAAGYTAMFSPLKIWSNLVTDYTQSATSSKKAQ